MIIRRLVVVAVGLLLAVQIVRNAAVAALATLQPATAARFWAGHPAVEISLGLAQIGSAARSRGAIDPRTFAAIDDAATKSPLAAEPFLVRGVEAQMAGDAQSAKLAFLAAQWRDPRSLPAAYFLANYYFRAGNPLEGLKQAALLAKLAPNGTEAVAPFVAAYAQNRSNWPQIRALFRSENWLEDPVLAILAQAPLNANAILALADRGHRKPDSLWLRILLSKLVASGDYTRALAMWSSVGRGHAGEGLIYDATFSAPEPPPPFNWSLTSSTVGLAERQPGKRLHVIFYGNEDGVLASELLLLPPGSYWLQMKMTGAPVHPELLRWSVRCDKSQEPISEMAVDQAARRGWIFQVPADCPAQWLELSGRSGDFAQQSDVTISDLSLHARASNV